jgi:DNA repair exonuclease SbcCD ATPase subunit
MTPTSYYVALIAKSFGFDRRAKRLSDASSEMALLREAEHQLGRMLWEKIEPIEELSVEYWNLRKYIKELLEKRDSMNRLNDKLTILHDERAGILNEASKEQEALEEKRADLLLKLEKFANERDQLVRRAKEIRRIHEGHLTKIEVLERDGNKEKEIEMVKSEIITLKNEFRQLKEQRSQVADQLEEGDRIVDEIDQKLLELKQEKRDRAALVFQEMGFINRDLSNIRSEIGSIENQIRHLHAEVGRYISRYDKRNPECGKVARSERTMVEVMRMLRMSISMNHKLADFK